MVVNMHSHARAWERDKLGLMQDLLTGKVAVTADKTSNHNEVETATEQKTVEAIA